VCVSPIHIRLTAFHLEKCTGIQRFSDCLLQPAVLVAIQQCAKSPVYLVVQLISFLLGTPVSFDICPFVRWLVLAAFTVPYQANPPISRTITHFPWHNSGISTLSYLTPSADSLTAKPSLSCQHLDRRFARTATRSRPKPITLRIYYRP